MIDVLDLSDNSVDNYEVYLPVVCLNIDNNS